MSGSAATRFTRSANACESCRRRKVKCSGTQPCVTCHRQGLDCRFGNTTRRGYSEVYVQGLLATIDDQKRKLRAQSDAISIAGGDDSSSLSHHRSPSQQTTKSSTTGAANNGEDEPVTPVTDLASGPAFESRVRSILRDHHDNSRSIHASPESMVEDGLYADGKPICEWRNSSDLLKDATPPGLLSKKRSYELLDVFVSQMGVDQHFLDPRAFGDEMILLYKDERTRIAQTQTTWFIQYLLVMAMGMLIGSPSTGSGATPGSTYFAEAMRRLPPTYQLGSHGIIGVEILCLITLYLQWTDRKHDAYLYIGLAIRLAIALGCTLPQDEQQGLPSEICHRTRVWWTAYMLDRRLSAGLGLPTGADDRQLRAELPSASAGFQPPLPLIVNIEIARVTGEIITSFYGNSKISQVDLVARIQDTLKTLHERGRTIPPEYAIDFSETHPTNVSRTSATLYLMLFQAIILCTRPILLQRVKEKVDACKRNDSNAPVSSTVISRLCRSCKEAASKSIKILSSLRKQRTIALFGYFDLDHTFSAAIVLMMKGFIHSNNPQKPPEGLAEAVQVLQYLSAAGNKAAEQRLSDLKQFCYHVWSPDKMSEEWKWLGPESPVHLANPSNAIVAMPTSAATPRATGVGELNSPLTTATAVEPYNNFWPETWDGWDKNKFGPSPEEGIGVEVLNFDMETSLQMDLSREAGDIYSSFNDPNLPLTGDNETDWAEIGKMFGTRFP